MIKIAVDAMGGDSSPKKIIDGIIHNHQSNKEVCYKIFGDQNKISEIIKGKINKDFFEIFHTENVVKSADSPLEGAKRGKNTSMWLAIESVKKKDCDIVISAGNTGALLVISKLNLKMIDNIDKPALSALWPNKKGMSVVLDLGANIECSSKNLFDFSVMGASLYKSLYPEETPNVALKTAEGTAGFITGELKKAMTGNLIGKISSFLNISNLRKFKKRLDPRLYNGAIFIGLDSPVVKSHGGTDYVGFSNSIDVCYKIVKGDLISKIKENI